MTDTHKESRDVLLMAETVAAKMYGRYPPRGPSQRPTGYARGIDFYSERDFIQVIANIYLAYREKGGMYPNLIEPELYSEKLNTLKLLSWMRLPESGNKLLTANFLIPEARPLLLIPEVVWRSTRAILPLNGSIPDGEYFFKANHGSGFFRRIRYPLTLEDRIVLESLGRRWLKLDYGLHLGEWWYNVFEKAVFLERSVTGRNPSAVILFYMFRERVGLISVDEKLTDGTGRTRESLFDSSFCLLPDQIVDSEPVSNFYLSDDTKERALAAAETIGRQFEAVRVDVIPGDNGELYLNEITFSSQAGLPLQNTDRDLNMGRMWGDC